MISKTMVTNMEILKKVNIVSSVKRKVQFNKTTFYQLISDDSTVLHGNFVDVLKPPADDVSYKEPFLPKVDDANMTSKRSKVIL